MSDEQVKDAQKYRIKTAPPVCGNCLHVSPQDTPYSNYLCKIGKFAVNPHLGTCPEHKWAKR